MGIGTCTSSDGGGAALIAKNFLSGLISQGVPRLWPLRLRFQMPGLSTRSLTAKSDLESESPLSSNENKLSRGERECAWLRVEGF